MFKPQQKTFALPHLQTSTIEDAYDQMELLGFPLCSYFDLINETLQPHIKAKELKQHINKKVLLYGVLVNTRFHKTTQGKRIRFCTFTDQDGHYFDTVHFTKVVHQYPIHGIGVYACYGTVTSDFDFCSLDIIWSRKLEVIGDPRG